jgi:hypothetical protein
MRIFFVALLGCSVSLSTLWQAGSAAGADAPTSSPNSQVEASVLPEGFEGVHLGMSGQELLKARAGKPSAMFGDDSQAHLKVYIEKYGKSPFFDSVIYGFADQTDALESVTFVRKLSPTNGPALIERFKAGVVGKWGAPDDILVENQKGSESPVLLWRKDGLIVLASYPGEGSVPGSGYAITVRMIPQATPVERVIKLVQKPKVLDLEAIKADLRLIHGKVRGGGEIFR